MNLNHVEFTFMENNSEEKSILIKKNPIIYWMTSIYNPFYIRKEGTNLIHLLDIVHHQIHKQVCQAAVFH